MKLIIFLSMLLFFSCAHRHACTTNCSMHSKKHEAFNKHCAMSVSEGDMNVAGMKEYTFEHGGETYYFSSKKKMQTFKEDIAQNLSKAGYFWAPTNKK